MKKIWIPLLLLGTILLAACGGQSSAPPTATGAPAAAAANTAVPPNPQPTGDVPAAISSHDPEDLALIGNTGKPQFINIYASW